MRFTVQICDQFDTSAIMMSDPHLTIQTCPCSECGEALAITQWKDCDVSPNDLSGQLFVLLNLQCTGCPLTAIAQYFGPLPSDGRYATIISTTRSMKNMYHSFAEDFDG